MRCDCYADLISQFKAATTFETFFGEKHLDVAKKLGPVARGQPVEEWNVASDGGEPLLWKRLCPEPPPPLLPHQTEHQIGI